MVLQVNLLLHSYLLQSPARLQVTLQLQELLVGGFPVQLHIRGLLLQAHQVLLQTRLFVRDVAAHLGYSAVETKGATVVLGESWGLF